MCLICIEFEKQRMTLSEARRAYGEMVEKIGPAHAREVEALLERAAEAEAPSSSPTGTR